MEWQRRLASISSILALAVFFAPDHWYRNHLAVPLGFATTALVLWWWRSRQSAAALLAVTIVVTLPFTVQASPAPRCPSIAQVAQTLRLATPSEVAAYKATLSPECRDFLARSSHEVFNAHGRFAMAGSEVWIPASAENGAGGNPSMNDYGSSTPDFNREQINLGRSLMEIGAMVTGAGLAAKNATVATIGGIVQGVGALMTATAANMDGGGSGGGGGKGPGDGSH